MVWSYISVPCLFHLLFSLQLNVTWSQIILWGLESLLWVAFKFMNYFFFSSYYFLDQNPEAKIFLLTACFHHNLDFSMTFSHRILILNQNWNLVKIWVCKYNLLQSQSQVRNIASCLVPLSLKDFLWRILEQSFHVVSA